MTDHLTVARERADQLDQLMQAGGSTPEDAAVLAVLSGVLHALIAVAERSAR